MANGFAEAPTSWNVRYRTPDGFDAMLTLRGESGAELLPKTAVAIEWLLEHDCTPNGGKRSPGGGGHSGNGSSDPGWCSIHNVAMKQRSQNGESWYSHKAGDAWCRGK